MVPSSLHNITWCQLMALNLQSPTPFEAGDIKLWIQDLEMFMIAAIGNVTDERKKAILITCIGDQGRAVINNIPPARKATYEALKGELTAHFETFRM